MLDVGLFSNETNRECSGDTNVPSVQLYSLCMYSPLFASLVIDTGIIVICSATGHPTVIPLI
jgi:hypothetical protein